MDRQFVFNEKAQLCVPPAFRSLPEPGEGHVQLTSDPSAALRSRLVFMTLAGPHVTHTRNHTGSQAPAKAIILAQRWAN